jgi:hypothetical protein
MAEGLHVRQPVVQIEQWRIHFRPARCALQDERDIDPIRPPEAASGSLVTNGGRACVALASNQNVLMAIRRLFTRGPYWFAATAGTR